MKRYLKGKFNGLFASFATKADINKSLPEQFKSLRAIKEIIGPCVPLGSLSGLRHYPPTRS